MKVVVQHPITHHYLDSTDQWKSTLNQARVFSSAAEAVTHCARNLKMPYNVVLKFEDPEYDFAIFGDKNSEITAMREQSREMIRSSNLMVTQSRQLVEQSKAVIAASKQRVAGTRRRPAR